MKKILIVGHPQAGCTDIEHVLRTHGMAPPRPSRREGLLPDQISAALYKAYAIDSAADPQSTSSGALEQLQPGPVWHGLALDLLLGNLEQPLWGWSDPAALPWLDFWQALDPTLQFVLVYDQPQSIVTRLSPATFSTTSPDELIERLRHWTGYNKALLDFFQRHSDRCLLVHSACARDASEDVLPTLIARLAVPWRQPDCLATKRSGDGTTPITAAFDHTTQTTTDWLDEPSNALDVRVLQFVADQLLRADSESQSLYNKLQSQAQVRPALAIGSISQTAAARAAWCGLQAQYRRHRRLSKALDSSVAARDASERLAEERHAAIVQQGLEAKQTQQVYEARLTTLDQTHVQDRQQWRTELAQLRSQAENARQRYARHAAESLVTLNTLAEAAQAQRDRLEQSLAQAQQQCAELNARWESRLAEVQATERTARDRLEAEANTLRKQVRQTAAPRVNGDEHEALRAENAWMLEQLHELQREIERLERGLPRHMLAAGNPAASGSQPASDLFGAADRVRECLAYRVGATMIRHARSPLGWLCLPGSLLVEIWRHHRHQRNSAKQTRPPLHVYRDVQEAERIKLHLSYRLGLVTLANLRHPLGWMRLPFHIIRELRAYRTRQKRSLIGPAGVLSDTHA